jgi:chitinase
VPLPFLKLHFNLVAVAGAQIFQNTTDVTSYSYNAATKELVTYDTPAIVKLKAQYTVTNNLAGSMFWELSTDKVGSESLVTVSQGVFGSLDQTPNHIKYKLTPCSINSGT